MSTYFIRLSAICLLFLLKSTAIKACQCPLTELSSSECDKYEIIFKGKIISVTPCNDKFGTAIFEIGELYKGNATKQFAVLFECGVTCAAEFNVGEEWIIYSRYKQIDKAIMDWCSRSRKHFTNAKEDFYSVTYGNDYEDELKFLQKKLGLHRTRTETKNGADNRNKMPTKNQMIILLVVSLSAILLFYWLFNKYFKF